MSYYGPLSYYQLGRVYPRSRVRQPFHVEQPPNILRYHRHAPVLFGTTIQLTLSDTLGLRDTPATQDVAGTAPPAPPPAPTQGGMADSGASPLPSGRWRGRRRGSYEGDDGTPGIYRHPGNVQLRLRPAATRERRMPRYYEHGSARNRLRFGISALHQAKDHLTVARQLDEAELLLIL